MTALTPEPARRSLAVYRLGDDVPVIARDTFVAPSATLVGKV